MQNHASPLIKVSSPEIKDKRENPPYSYYLSWVIVKGRGV